jgi:hypothetical protein
MHKIRSCLGWAYRWNGAGVVVPLKAARRSGTGAPTILSIASTTSCGLCTCHAAKVFLLGGPTAVENNPEDVKANGMGSGLAGSPSIILEDVGAVIVGLVV